MKSKDLKMDERAEFGGMLGGLLGGAGNPISMILLIVLGIVLVVAVLILGLGILLSLNAIIVLMLGAGGLFIILSRRTDFLGTKKVWVGFALIGVAIVLAYFWMM